jgi:hypothetical protein
MRDPLDELENFTNPGLTMDPLPASEVRRRGTRMRRRNNALAAIGGVAVVAIIATPLAMAATGDRTDTTPPVTTQPPSPTTWVTEIPAEIPLTAGMPRATAQEGYEALADADACAGLGWSPDGPPATVDLQQVYQTENEGGWERTLAVYADEDAARQSLLDLQSRVQECAASTEGEARSTEAVSSDASSLVYVDHISEAGDMFQHQVVQVGNALLLDTVLSFGGGDPAVIERNANQLEKKSAPVIDAMCVFAADPC